MSSRRTAPGPPGRSTSEPVTGAPRYSTAPAPRSGMGRSRPATCRPCRRARPRDRKSTRLNSSHVEISYAVFCLKKKKKKTKQIQIVKKNIKEKIEIKKIDLE